jgi:hypothetical protein
MACQRRDEPVTVEICPELAALRIANPCQAIGARCRHRLLGRAQIVLPDHEGDYRVGVSGSDQGFVFLVGDVAPSGACSLYASGCEPRLGVK